MWRKALGDDGKRIIDIRVRENHGEAAKYVTKPGGYLELTGEQWQCDDRVLETLHYGLASWRVSASSSSLSRIRKESWGSWMRTSKARILLMSGG
jgi:hypothetical protein